MWVRNGGGDFERLDGGRQLVERGKGGVEAIPTRNWRELQPFNVRKTRDPTIVFHIR